MQNVKFLPSLTTVTMRGEIGNWMAQIEEIQKLNLKEIAIFPTLLEKEERFKLYKILKESPVERVPFVHLRTDMELKELDYLVENFQTEVFNLHTTTNWPLLHNYSKYAKRIFIENGKFVPKEEELEKFGGLCIDFSHWENSVLLGDVLYHQKMLKLIQKFSVGICHISSIKNKMISNPFKPELQQYDSHLLLRMNELDYLKKYKLYIPTVAAIELENAIAEQLKIKTYLKNILR
jgi:hypothetical protein